MVRVLVVEDEPDIRNVLADALGDEGYQVDCAADGASALALIRTGPADLAVVDLMMPGLDGYAFVRACRASPLHARMPVVIVTAARKVDDPSLDVSAVIHKPFDLNDLLDTIIDLASPTG